VTITDVSLMSSIFIVVYGLIISEKIHRAIVSMAGAIALVVLGVLQQNEAFNAIDFNTIGLLIGMMIIVGITRRTGVFEYIAIKSAKIARGEPVKILILLAAVTAITSALLDNVTTVLLMVPVTIVVTQKLKVDPIPYLFAEIISSNIGGTATLVGDPPNIIIGGATSLGFMDFIYNLTPVVLVMLPVVIMAMVLVYGNSLKTRDEYKQSIMKMDESAAIKDYPMLWKSLGVLGLTIIGFLLHQSLNLESATIALGGAVLLMLLVPQEPEEIFRSVEWPTLFFFAGLFIIVQGLVNVGIIDMIAKKALALTQGDPTLTIISVLWFSGIASAIVDNIPLVTSMIPLLESMGQMGNIALEPLWWSLALGACLGGNGTLIGASANVVVAGICAKSFNLPITFTQFLKVGFPLMILTLIISTAYVYLRYILII
jgi:Na+/H+ antiporter NhaD/arsenite permease-like protein